MHYAGALGARRSSASGRAGARSLQACKAGAGRERRRHPSFQGPQRSPLPFTCSLHPRVPWVTTARAHQPAASPEPERPFLRLCLCSSTSNLNPRPEQRGYCSRHAWQSSLDSPPDACLRCWGPRGSAGHVQAVGYAMTPSARCRLDPRHAAPSSSGMQQSHRIASQTLDRIASHADRLNGYTPTANPRPGPYLHDPH